MHRSCRAFLGALIVAALCGCGENSPPAPGAPTPNVATPTPNLSTKPFVDDPAQAVVSDARWASYMQLRLATIEWTDKVTIFVQFHDKSPPADEDKNPGDYMRALATKLGVIKDGVLMVHFADDPDWRVWIGDDLTPKFVGSPGDAKAFTESGAMHEAKEAYLKASMAMAKQRFDTTSKSITDKDEAARRVLELQADALVYNLCIKLELK
jgi:hypothetical protein